MAAKRMSWERASGSLGLPPEEIRRLQEAGLVGLSPRQEQEERVPDGMRQRFAEFLDAGEQIDALLRPHGKCLQVQIRQLRAGARGGESGGGGGE